MTKKYDPDILILKRCCKALEKSSSQKMLAANMEFLIDKYCRHHFELRSEYASSKTHRRKHEDVK